MTLSASEPLGDGRQGERAASRWADAWSGGAGDLEAADQWRRLRDRLDPLLEEERTDLDGLSESGTAELRALLGADRGVFDLLDEWTRGAGSATDEHPDASAGSLAPGARFGGCGIVRLVGRGGMGEVYEAIDESLGDAADRRVALKLLRPEMAGGTASLDRDVSALSRLEHPSIARLYRAGLDRLPRGGERRYLVTEFVDGEPLLRFVERRCGGDARSRHRLLPALGERLAEALAASHDRGVVHRDVKSSNVLVREDESLAVVDFGIASLEEASASEGRTLADRLTAQPDAAGSLGSISPERARGRSSGVREDVWAIGRLLFEGLTGRRPLDLDALPLYEAIRRIGDTPPPRIREVDHSLPRDLAVVVDRCLAFDPADRYPDAETVRIELRRVRCGIAPLARPIGPLGRGWRLARRYPVASGFAAAAALLLVAGAAVSSLLAFAAGRAESEAIAAKAAVVEREQLVRSVADGLLVEVAETLRTVPGATLARRRLLEIGLAYAEAVGEESFLATDREAALELARAVFALGELHRLQQPNATEDALGRAAFERAGELARLASQASDGLDAEALGLAANADSLAIDGRTDLSLDELDAAWAETIALAERALAADPTQADALVGLYRSNVRIGNRARLEGDRDRAMEFFARGVAATEILVEAHPDRSRTWFHRSAALNSMWWLLYTEFREGNQARILEILDAMIDAERREDAILSTTNSSSSVAIVRMMRIFVAIEFGLIAVGEAEESLAELEASIVAMSEAEPELGLLRRRRAEAHLRRGDALGLLVERAIEAGDGAEARRLAADAAVAFESLVEVQRDRLARREHTATNEDAMLAYGIEHAAAMRAVVEGETTPP